MAIPPPPASEWDPTICIVGDMKQSIYRFRQAEVTVMKRAVAYIREMNREEAAMENRTDDLRRKETLLKIHALFLVHLENLLLSLVRAISSKKKQEGKNGIHFCE